MAEGELDERGGGNGEEPLEDDASLRPSSPQALATIISASSVLIPNMSASTSASKPRATRAKQPDWRRKYREEIARLRVQAASLSATAARLRAAVCGQAEGAEPVEDAAAGPPSAAALWKRIAKRQLATRAAAEQENVRLRAQVEQRRKETHELRRAALFRRANVQGVRELLGVGWTQGERDTWLGVDADDARVFRSLRGGIDALYAELDAAFARGRVAAVRCPGRSIETKASESGQIVWEFVDVHAVPFDRRAAAHALWLALGERGWQQQRGSDTQASADECMTRVRFRVSVPVLSITVLTRKVTKRFVERGRVVFVSSSVHQPIFNGKLSPRAAVFHEVDRTVVCGDARRSEIRRLITATTGGDGIAQVATEGPDWRATDRHSAGVHAWAWAISRDKQAIEDELLRGASQQ